MLESKMAMKAKPEGGLYADSLRENANIMNAHRHALPVFQMLHNMKGQFAEHLMRVGFISSKDPKDPKSNVNSGEGGVGDLGSNRMLFIPRHLFQNVRSTRCSGSATRYSGSGDVA